MCSFTLSCEHVWSLSLLEFQSQSKMYSIVMHVSQIVLCYKDTNRISPHDKNANWTLFIYLEDLWLCDQ